MIPSLARAEGAEEPPQVQEVRAVERGFFTRGDVGFGWLVNKVNDRSFSPSLYTGVSVGYDILPILSLSAGALAFSASVNNPKADKTGDFLFLIPMAELQLALVTTERNFLYVRGGAGFSFGLPAQISGADYGGNGPAFSGTIGFERYTKLRHFSLGIQAGALVLLKPGFGLGVQIAPTLKYTF